MKMIVSCLVSCDLLASMATSRSLILAGALAVLGGCGDDSDEGGSGLDSGAPLLDAGTGDGGAPRDGSSPVDGSPLADGGTTTEMSKGPLVIVTEREAPDSNLQYLHVVSDWPADGKLDYSKAIELGEFVNVHAFEGAVYVYQPEDASMRKFTVGADLKPVLSGTISFMAYGVAGFDADNIWASADRAFLVDENSAQIVRWNPATLQIVPPAAPIDRALLQRNGLKAQLQQGIALGGRAYMAVNWRDWETFDFVPGVALGYFDTSSDQPALQLIEDARCASSVALNAFADEQGNVYVIGDGGLGFDVMASPKKTTLPQCVLRVRPGETTFDPGFFVNLQETTGSPGVYTVHPMPMHKLLVNAWAPSVRIQDVVDTSTSEWYWENPPYFEHAIVDLESQTSTPVSSLPRAAAQWSITLRVDGKNYVQTYAADGSVTLYRVDADATTTQVLKTEVGTDVQYLGRL